MLFDDFIFLINFLVCFIVMWGNMNLHFGFVISCSNIWVWVIVLGVKLFLIFIILFMKWLLAILDIFLSEVMTLFSWIMFLGGALVLVLVNSLTVVQSLFMLLTSGLMCVLFVLSILLFLLLMLLPLLLVLSFVIFLLFMVSFCE